MNYAEYILPLDGFNILNYMALAVCIRGRQESVDFFNLVADEMERMLKSGESQFKAEQKYRYMWEGIAVWPYLSHNYKTLKNLNAIYVGSTYPLSWNIDYEVDDIDAMASDI
jgi:benzoyl-CoA reductase/2-hydroxyglutaryl-CoA dehydratase subunit BcrC/BadD/HgdB